MKSVWNYYVVKFKNGYGDASYLSNATTGAVSEDSSNVHVFSFKSTAKQALDFWAPRIAASSATIALRRGWKNQPSPYVLSESFDPPKFADPSAEEDFPGLSDEEISKAYEGLECGPDCSDCAEYRRAHPNEPADARSCRKSPTSSPKLKCGLGKGHNGDCLYRLDSIFEAFGDPLPKEGVNHFPHASDTWEAAFDYAKRELVSILEEDTPYEVFAHGADWHARGAYASRLAELEATEARLAERRGKS